MNTYPPDMKLVETLTDDEILSEYSRRVVARGGAIVVAQIQQVVGKPGVLAPSMTYAGNLYTCIGLNQYSGRVLAMALFSGQSSP